MRFFCIAWLLLPACLLRAGEGYVFSRIDSGDGLSENRTRHIAQLPDNRMVVMTDGLVNLYDGAEFRYMHIDDENVYLLEAYQGYHRPFIDAERYLWVKDYRRLLLFDIYRERFVANLDSVFRRQGIKERVDDFFIDPEKRHWFLTKRNELLRKDAPDQKASVFIPNLDEWPDNGRLLELTTNKNRLFLFFESGGMACFDLKSGKELFRENPLAGQGKKQEGKIALTAFHGHSLYLVFNGDSGSLLRYDLIERKWETLLSREYWLYTLSVDEKGDIWASCDQGLWHIDRERKESKLLSAFRLKGGESLRTGIHAHFQDNQGGLWLATSNRGLLYYHPNRFKFKQTDKSGFGVDNEREFRVNCFVEKDDELLIGTPIGLYRYARAGSVISRADEIPHEFRCYRLSKDRDGRIWVCAAEHGLYCIEGKSVRNFSFPSSVFYLYENPDGSLFLSIGTGFGLFDPATGEYRQIETTRRLNVIYQMAEYGRDAVIGLSDLGVFTYDRKTGDLQLTPTFEKNRPAMLRQNNYRYDCLHSDSRGLIWLGTRDGLSVWDPEENRLKIFHTEDGLVNNRIQSIIEDKQSHIWVATSGGISRIEVTGNERPYGYSFSNFNRYDGVTGNEFFERSAYCTEAGVLFWGGIDGFNEIDPKETGENARQLPTPLFSRLFIAGSEIRQGEKYGGKVLLQQSLTTTGEVRLSHNQNFIAFEFSALNYANPTQTYYRFKLEGIDADWQEMRAANGIGRANYTNLPPGRYKLKVYAANNDRKWNDTFAEIDILIAPRFWQTPFAYILYVLSFFALFGLATAYYLKKKREKMERLQKETLDQMKYRFYTNMSHELRTPLTLIITPLDALLKKMEESALKRQLAGIYKNAKVLLSIVNQLLDFRKLEMTGETLHLSYCDLEELLEEAAASFAPVATEKTITLRCESRLASPFAYADKDKLRKIVSNLLSNACKFTSEGGRVELLLDKACLPDSQIEAFLIRVSDTGRGILPKDLPYIFDRFYQTDNQGEENTGSGIGLHLAQEYARLHDGIIQAESNGSEGCVFSVYIPLYLQPERSEEPDLQPEKKNLKLLVIEDNREFRDFLLAQLSAQYTVAEASNGKEGLEKARTEQPDLIVSDVMMPEMSGTEMCALLKNDLQVSHIPVILLTARSSDEARIEGYRSGADAYIAKPFNMDILLLQIGRLIALQKERKELFRKAIVIRPESVTTSSVDEKLIKDALSHVEKNLDNPLYSVDQLSKDMKMDRTGLYRKLVAIAGLSPNAFIRSIRLKRAAQLLEQGYTVSEVADRVGFGTISYFSKCFQEEYGVKPSQYDKQRSGMVSLKRPV